MSVESPNAAEGEPSDATPPDTAPIDAELPDAEAHHSAAERLRAAQAYAAAARVRVETARPRYRSLDLAFTVGERDQRVGGGLLAGALAFRLFLWVLPACLVVVGGLGFGSRGWLDNVVNDNGVGGLTADVIAQATTDSDLSRWVALLLGLYFLYFAAVALARAVVAATAFSWQIPIPRIANKPRAALLTSAVLFAAGAAVLAGNILRARSSGPGLILTFSLVVFWTGLWWYVSSWLPRSEQARPLDLWPGAVLVGIGAQAMHLVSVLYLSHKIQSASGLYGSLGTAAVLLLAGYLMARLMIGSCVLNATLVKRREIPPITPYEGTNPYV